MDLVRDSSFENDEKLAKAAKKTLQLPLTVKQLVINCDASDHSAGYVLLTEDYMGPSEGTHMFPPFLLQSVHLDLQPVKCLKNHVW